MKSLVERYAHLLSNDIFVERYLVSREKNVEVTARKVSSHGDSRANGSMWFAAANSGCEKDFWSRFSLSLSLSLSLSFYLPPYYLVLEEKEFNHELL